MKGEKKTTSFNAVMTRLNVSLAGEPRQAEVTVASSGRFNAQSLKEALLSGKVVKVTIKYE